MAPYTGTKDSSDPKNRPEFAKNCRVTLERQGNPTSALATLGGKLVGLGAIRTAFKRDHGARIGVHATSQVQNTIAFLPEQV